MARVAENLFGRGKRVPWMEMAALLPATMLLAPLLLYGAIGTMFALIGLGTGRSIPVIGMLPIFLLLAEMFVGVASLACLWLLLLGGMRVMERKPPLRRLAIVLLVLGLADATYFLSSSPKVTAEITSGVVSVLMWIAILVLPMLLGARYIYLLMRLSPTDAGPEKGL